MTRRPRLCSQPLASLTSMPISTRARVPRGVRPSPQTFSRGNDVFSISATSSPAVASQYAALLPAGPAPTTTTSASLPRPGATGSGRVAAAGADMHAPGSGEEGWFQDFVNAFTSALFEVYSSPSTGTKRARRQDGTEAGCVSPGAGAAGAGAGRMRASTTSPASTPPIPETRNVHWTPPTDAACSAESSALRALAGADCNTTGACPPASARA